MKFVLSQTWDYIKRLDKLLLLLCLVACGFSILLLYTLNENEISSRVTETQYKTQIAASLLGLAGAMLIAGINYKFLSKIWFTYAPIALILTLLLFTSLGIRNEGADDIGWLRLGPITFQPSEILKIAFIMTFATHLSKVREKMNQIPHFLLLCLNGLAPAALVSIQGDDGTALVFLFIFITMMFAAGVSWKYMLLAVVAAPAACYVAWNFLMQNHHKLRFLILFDEELQAANPDSYYQQLQGLIALGSGELTGKGLTGGTYTYVPEIDSDYIFSYIGMTLGFIGCVATIVLLATISIKVLSVSSASKDPLGKYICVGVFAMILFHTVINVGMVLGVMPVVGIPLPFISAGGTSVLSMFLGIGLVLSVYGHRDTKYHLFYSEKD